MTRNGNLKRRVRARAAKTGESYTAALRHVRPASFRLAVAQTQVPADPGDAEAIRAGGRQVRDLMQAAHHAGAPCGRLPGRGPAWCTSRRAPPAFRSSAC